MGGFGPKLSLIKWLQMPSRPSREEILEISSWLGWDRQKKVREQFDTEEKEEGSRLAMVTVAKINILGSHQIRI